MFGFSGGDWRRLLVAGEGNGGSGRGGVIMVGQCEEQRQGCNSSVTFIVFLFKNTHNLLAT